MFHCEACVTSFTRHDNLRRHIKMHDSSGFKCNFCDKLFTRNDNLSRHIRIFHSGKEACSGLVIKDGNVNESQDDIPTSVMWEWDDAVNYVVCNKAHDATRVDVRLSVKDDNITISPLVFVPNNQAGISEYGSTKINIDRLSGNTIDENYKDQIKKNWAWIKEMLSLINSIEGKNEEQQKIILQDVMTIWHAIHDSHASNLEKQGESLISNSAATKPKVYVYGKQLSFPEKNEELRNTNSNFEDFHANIFEEKSYNINGTETNQNSSSNTDDGIRCLEVEKNSSSFSECSTNKRKKASVEKALIHFIKNYKIKRIPKEKDEDLEFFNSLLPTVKSLTPDQKYRFRIQTMQCLYDLNSESLSSIEQPINNSSNIPSSLYITPVNSFESPTCTPDIDFVWKSSATPTAASYYSKFSAS